MMKKRILSFALALVTALPAIPAFAAPRDDVRTTRQVYLHAQGADYAGSTDRSVLYKGETSNIYFAVNDPNMGDYIKPGSQEETDEIKAEIQAAIDGKVNVYAEEVIAESKAAVIHARDRISSWWTETDTQKRDVIEDEFKNSRYSSYLSFENLSDLTAADFENDVFIIDRYLEKFNPAAYSLDTVFDAVYDNKVYDYGFTYVYEYEYYYLSKINSAVRDLKLELIEYNNAVSSVTTTVARKEALKQALLEKYNEKAGLDILVIDSATYEASLSPENEKLYRAYIREKSHFDRIDENGLYYVAKDAVESVRHREPQFDLSGYRVRIYFDPNFFDVADPTNPLRYDTPGAYISESKDETVNGSTETTPLGDGLWTYKKPEYVQSSTGYHYVQTIIFANGIHFPNKSDDSWYELCALPLIPKRVGPTQVYIEPVSTSQNAPLDDIKFPLTLYAKHDPKVSDQDFVPNFSVSPLHGGFHYINIVEKPNPATPIASPVGGRYKDVVNVELTSDEDDCTIYYTIGDDPYPYVYSVPNPNGSGVIVQNGPITLQVTSTISFWAERTEKLTESEKLNPPVSNIGSATYTIVPDWPYLWAEDNPATDNAIDPVKPIIAEYYDDEPFYVYPSEGADEYDGNFGIKSFYYTFNKKLTEADLPADTMPLAEQQKIDPEVGWRLLPAQDAKILIDEQRTLYMIAKRGAECSDITSYRLGIKPNEVVAKDYYDDVRHTTPQEVVLYSPLDDGVTPNPRAVVLYTTDGRDPRDFGVTYTNPITVSQDTVITATAYLVDENGQPLYDEKGELIYADNTSFYYLFDSYQEDRIDAFYPGGVYDGPVDVTLSAQDPNLDIVYYIKNGAHVDGFEPAEDDFSVYCDDSTVAEPIEVDRNSVIYAKIRYQDGNETTYGDLYRFEYIIKPKPPIFSQTSTQFTNSLSIDISTDQRDADGITYRVYYTVDDGIPTITNNVGGGASIHSNVTIKEDYTTIKAVVYADYGDGTGQYSSVVTHAYTLVKNRPAQPLTTLLPGRYYIHENGKQEGFSTQFVPVPSDMEIYYTISYNGEPPILSPWPDEEDANGNPIATKYDPKDPLTKDIEIKGETVIMAVAVNKQGVRSDVGTFVYVVTPEAPEAAPSAILNSPDGSLPAIPVTAVPGATITYKIADENGDTFTVTFTAPEDNGEFYINPTTGLPTIDKDGMQPITPVQVTGTSGPLQGSITLRLSAELNGIKSPEKVFLYGFKWD